MGLLTLLILMTERMKMMMKKMMMKIILKMHMVLKINMNKIKQAMLEVS